MSIKSNVPEAEKALHAAFPFATRARAHAFAVGVVRFSVDFEVSVKEYLEAEKKGPAAIQKLIASCYRPEEPSKT